MQTNAIGKGWSSKKCYAAMTMPYYQHLIVVPEAWSPGTGGPVKDKALLMKVETEEDLEQYRGKLAGRIVVIWQDTKMTMNFDPEAKRYSDEELEKVVMERAVAPPQSSPPSFTTRPCATKNCRASRCRKRNTDDAFCSITAPYRLRGRGHDLHGRDRRRFLRACLPR